jgi:hypothetical protein
VELGLYCLLRNKLDLEPSEVSTLMGIMSLPWMLKLFLAITSDTVSLNGSRRKSYLYINSVCNFLVIGSLSIFQASLGKYFVIFSMLISQVNMTWCDSMTDALIAKMSKESEEVGSNLYPMVYFAYAMGGLVGCVGGAMIGGGEDS